ncbi:hypothetical protein Selin_0189 [Desulfurispirillum indicum S5]|uniref:Prepilin-type N-terminal cleavage/methylation domain-containing protein n=1 Tax=Desulfurispirillum indicum (strain ATCC BAA-1389 / DSM 22839 / S5) TaxID=653733 RepID=E6W607_DESIS|nr:type II secretion system protein [Desulfurispirillum indicum]ADU64946.1 hypothetical protein Selin_0189 [Desulfurispirillum indicum S5]
MIDSRNHREQGFSLLELILTMVIIGILSAASAPMVGSAINAYFTARQMSDELMQVNMAMERVSRELRGALAIDTNSDQTTVRFTRRSDSQEVCFRLNQGRIWRHTGNCANPGHPLTGAVFEAGSTFLYGSFGTNCTNPQLQDSAAAPQNAHLVQLHLTSSTYGAFRTSVYVNTAANPCHL